MKNRRRKRSARFRCIREEGVHWLGHAQRGFIRGYDRTCDPGARRIRMDGSKSAGYMRLNRWKSRIPWQKQDASSHSGKAGQVFISHADFICPDNCPEPKDKCTVTGKPRPKDLFRLLRDLDIDDALCRLLFAVIRFCPALAGFIRKT
jgi:hypothetical protein